MAVDNITASPACQGYPRFGAFFRPYRRYVLLGALLGLLLGVGIALTRPVVYSASTTLLFPGSDKGLGGLAGLGGGDSMSSIPLLGGMLQVPRPGTNSKTAMLLLRSWPVQDVVIKQQQLTTAWQSRKMGSVRAKLRRQLSLKDGSSGELRIVFSDQSPEVAYNVTVALVSEMERRAKTLGINPAEQSVDFLTQQLDNAHVKLAAAQESREHFEKQYGVISLDDQQSALARQYTNLQDDMEKAHLDATLSSRYATLLTANAQRLIKECMDPAANSTLNARYQRVDQLASQLALMRGKFTPTHPEYQEVALQLKDERQRLSSEIERQLSLVGSGASPVVSTAIIDAALKQARQARLSETLSDMKRQIAGFPNMKSRYLQLTLELDAGVERVKLLRTELERARIAAMDRGPMFVVVEPAQMPEEPQPRKRLFILAMMTLLGAVIVTAIPYIKWQQALSAMADPHLVLDEPGN